MSLRFRRSISIIPGVRLNFSRSGLSTSIGPRGASMTIGPRGVYTNVGIPGTGISYRERVGGGNTGVRSTSRAARRAQREAERAAERQAAQEAHAAAQARLEALGGVLHHRVRAPFDWDAFVAPAGAFTTRPFVPPPVSFTADVAAREAAQHVDLMPWLVVLALGIAIMIAVHQTPGVAVGAIVLIIALVGLWSVRGQRAAYAARWLAEQTRAHDEAVKRLTAEHDDAEQRRAADWHASAARRDALRTAVERGDPEPLAELLEVELSNETLPVPLTFDVDFDGVTAVDVDLVLPSLDQIPSERTRITKTGKLSRRHMAQRDRTALYERLCCGLALRLMYEAFRVLPMLEQVTMRGTTTAIDPGTGHERRFDALRCAASREALEALDLDHVEPEAALEHLGGAFGCDRRGALTPVT
jgi:hypothetical protein